MMVALNDRNGPEADHDARYATLEAHPGFQGADGGAERCENAAARIAQLVLFDAVFAAVAQRDLAAAERNLSATLGAVKAKRQTT
jgi:DNA-binding MurR/RpiR family transcriptional regulator